MSCVEFECVKWIFAQLVFVYPVTCLLILWLCDRPVSIRQRLTNHLSVLASQPTMHTRKVSAEIDSVGSSWVCTSIHNYSSCIELYC